MSLLALLVGCNIIDQGERPPADPPVQTYVQMADQRLPVGFVGEPYEAIPQASGGTTPYTWRLGDDLGLPRGLQLATDGRLEGVPSEAGEHTFSVIATDAQGRSKRAVITVEIVNDPPVLQCGDTYSGAFLANGFDNAGPNFDDFDNIEWLAIAVPQDDTQRIELVFDNVATTTLYVERATELVGSIEIEEHYVGWYLNPEVSDMTVRIDPGTVPSLSGYETQPTIPLLLVAQTAGDWSFEVVCTDGPVIERLPQYPVELGLELDIDYDVWGPDEGVRIYPVDPLPDWMIWDEDTGRVTGTAEEVGTWEFTIAAETEDGRYREDLSILSVFEVHDVTCDSTWPFTVEESYYDGDYIGYWDPRGYRVFRLPLDGAEPSAIDLTLTGADAHFLGTADPAPEWLNFYAGAERIYTSGADALHTVAPTSYPAIGNYLDAGDIYVIAGSTGIERDLQLTLGCDRNPRPDMAGLPVVEPLVAADFPLFAIGGEPPYTWSATGLPGGLSVSTGRLQGTAVEVGSFDVALTVSDKNGASSTTDYVLYVGLDEACAGATRVTCGDSVGGTFTTTYFSDGSGPGSTEVLCLVDRGEVALGWEVYADDAELRVDIADPGATVDELLSSARYTYVAYVDVDSVEGIAMNPWSWPDLDDYAELPVFLSVRAYEPGDWTAHLTCE